MLSTMSKLVMLCISVVALLIGLSFCEEDLSNCELLDQSNFDEQLDKSNTFVMFFAPWCGHCKRLKPKWNEFCGNHNQDGSQMTVAAVDCTADGYICKKHGVTGYPTLKFFKKGDTDGSKYAGSREIAAFEKFASGIIDPTAVEAEPEVEPCGVPEPKEGLLELEDCNFKAATGEGHSLVKFYAPWCGHCKKMAPAWAELASSMQSVDNVKIVKVDCTTQKKTCEQYDVHGFPTVHYLRDGKSVEKYSGGRDVASLTEFLNNRVNGTEVPAKPQQAKEKCSKSAPDNKGMWEVLDCNFQHHIAHSDAFVMFYAPWCGHCKKLKPTWEKLAEGYLDMDSVRISRIDCTTNKETCAKYKVKGFPTLIYFRQGQELSPYAGSREFTALKDFVENKLSDIVVPERGLKQEKESPKKVEPLETVAQLEALRKDIRHSFAVIYYHASNSVHMRDREVFHDFKDRIMKGVDVMEVDCGVAEKLCKNQKAFSDDETFLLFYMGTKVYRLDSSIEKSVDNMKNFIKESMKDALTFMREEL